MRLADGLREAVFLERKNRFSCLVLLSGREETVYLPNSGRLDTVLFPGQKVYIVDKAAPSRRTRYDMVMTSQEGTLISVDSRIPGDLVYEALCHRALRQFSEYSSVKRETIFGRSRLDFYLSRGNAQLFMEVKSVTLVEAGMACFPDAPTTRGRRHMESLVQATEEGHEAAVIFVIQRNDVECFSPNIKVDPDFGIALRKAIQMGVDVYAYRCRVSKDEIKLAGQVPVNL